MAASLTTSARTTILQQEIGRYVSRGFRVVSQTELTAQLVKPKSMGAMGCILWLVIIFISMGLGLIIFIPYYLSLKDQQVYLEVDEQGHIHRR